MNISNSTITYPCYSIQMHVQMRMHHVMTSDVMTNEIYTCSHITTPLLYHCSLSHAHRLPLLINTL